MILPNSSSLSMRPCVLIGELERHVGAFGHRRLADAPRRDLHVLLLDGLDHLADRHAAHGQLVGIEPDPHAVVARAEEGHVADALQTRQVVLDVHQREIAQVKLVVTRVGRDQVDAQQNRRRFLLRGHALPLDLLRQLGFRDGNAVLHQHLRHVEVRAHLEGDVQVHLAVVGAFRRHVEHPLDAVDFQFDRRGHGLGHGLGVGAGIDGGHLDHGRRDLRVLGDRQLEEGDPAENHDDDGEHRGEDRPIDEEIREHGKGP